MKRNKQGVFAAVRMAAGTHRLLTAGTLLCAVASVLASLPPPLLLARIIDGLTGGLPLAFTAALLYFGSLALEGVLSSEQETLLEIFGQQAEPSACRDPFCPESRRGSRPVLRRCGYR